MAQECKLAVVNTPHSDQACCRIIFNRCEPELFDKLHQPLEDNLPKIFGKLDAHQKLLIKHGAKPVVIVENAAEFVSQMKNVHGFIEQIFDFILKDNKAKYTFVGSESFGMVIKPKWLEKFPNTDAKIKYGNNKTTAAYEETIKNIRERIQKMKLDRAIMHIGADLGGVGHYGILIKNGPDAIVFDSMQFDGQSSYSALFCQVSEDIFGIVPTILNAPSLETCPQPTGGFVSKKERDESQEDYLRRLQDLDSQNHFCYLWAIWYFHVFVVHGRKAIDEIFDRLYRDCIPFLAVIKRYVWSILHSFYPDDKILAQLITEVVSIAQGKDIDAQTADFLMRYFVYHFRYIWDDMGTGKFHLYAIIECDLVKFRNMRNINECLAYSLQKFDYILEEERVV